MVRLHFNKTGLGMMPLLRGFVCAAILRPRVRIPSTPYTLFQFVKLYGEKDENKQEGRDWPIFLISLDLTNKENTMLFVADSEAVESKLVKLETRSLSYKDFTAKVLSTLIGW